MWAQIVYGIVLGIVQGIAEFLPISSKGHLILVQGPLERWLGLESANPGPRRLEFDVILHFGTLIALLIVYRYELWSLRFRQWVALFVGTIPVGVIGLAFHSKAEEMFDAPVLTGFGLLGTAALLFLAQWFSHGERGLGDMSLARAAGIGLFQAAAILPGLSRSGTTITGACLLGFDRNTAARFSFYLAVPAIGGAVAVTAAKFVRHPEPFVNNSPIALATGAMVSLLVGVVSLQWLIRMISRGRLYWFAWYCLVVGLLTIALQTML